ncbi:MAG: beta-ketoacyl-ACP synthase [Holophaga sp.]|nr:beta-ketoacyl-ACP synthase [Holophaga sp.]
MTAAPVFLSALGLVNALGRGKAAVAGGLFRGETGGMRLEEGWVPGRQVRVGKVADPLAEFPGSRTERLLLAALAEIRDEVEAELLRFGPDRVGVVLGTSTSGVGEMEAAIVHLNRHGALPEGFHYPDQEMGAPALFLARHLGLRGPAYTVSTACTSSGKAIVSARNLLRLGLCDAVITGGADVLCRLTLNGFSSLGAATPSPTDPMSVHRAGINIGEGAVLFVLRREPAEVALLGVGESSDAYHISAPDPSGLGAETAMRHALLDAGLAGSEPGYLNLHATATAQNDAMESQAVARVFPHGIPCSGTKPLTGHLLGAAAATELAFCWLALQSRWNPEHLLPPHRWDGAADPALPALALVAPGSRDPGLRVCLSNAFAFGGNNLTLVAGRP